MPGVLLTKLTNQPILQNEVILFDGPPDYDDLGFIDPAQPGFIIVPVGVSRLQFGGHVAMSGMADGAPVHAWLQKNRLGDGTFRTSEQAEQYPGFLPPRMSVFSAPVNVQPGDRFNLTVGFHNASAIINAQNTTFWARVEQ